MIAMAVMLAAASPTAVEAERAFAADAQSTGQWTAFRKWSADDAVMFTPKPTNAHAFLKDRKDPAQAISWWPTASYVACDGSLAVNTGGWRRPDGSVGYFSTIWQRQADGGWKWIVDGGDALTVARGQAVKVQRASCRRPGRLGDTVPVGDSNTGSSRDHSLTWFWTVRPDNSREFTARLWTGKRYDVVIDDNIGPQ